MSSFYTKVDLTIFNQFSYIYPLRLFKPEEKWYFSGNFILYFWINLVIVDWDISKQNKILTPHFAELLKHENPQLSVGDIFYEIQKVKAF